MRWLRVDPDNTPPPRPDRSRVVAPVLITNRSVSASIMRCRNTSGLEISLRHNELCTPVVSNCTEMRLLACHPRDVRQLAGRIDRYRELLREPALDALRLILQILNVGVGTAKCGLRQEARCLGARQGHGGRRDGRRIGTRAHRIRRRHDIIIGRAIRGAGVGERRRARFADRRIGPGAVRGAADRIAGRVRAGRPDQRDLVIPGCCRHSAGRGRGQRRRRARRRSRPRCTPPIRASTAPARPLSIRLACRSRWVRREALVRCLQQSIR